jgi:hypothetical protein
MPHNAHKLIGFFYDPGRPEDSERAGEKRKIKGPNFLVRMWSHNIIEA